MPIKDILTSKVVFCDPDSHLSVAANTMIEKKISSLLVVDGDTPIGIVTESNLVRMANDGRPFETTKVKDVMSSPLVTAHGDLDVFDAYRVICSNGIRHIAIVDDDGKAVGIVSYTNIISGMGLAQGMVRKVSKIMTKKPLTCSPSDSLKEVISKMVEENFSYTIAMKERKPLGIVSERDVARLLTERAALDRLTVAEVMSHPLLSIDPNMPIQEAARLMRERKHRRLVVTSGNGNLSGVVSQGDIIKGMMEGRYIQSLKDIVMKEEQVLSAFEETLIKKTIFLDSMLNSAKDLAVIATDTEMRIVYFNSAAEDVFGYKLNQVIGKTVMQIHSKEKDGNFMNFEMAMNQVREEGEYSVIIELKRGCEKRVVGLRISPIIDYRDRKKTTQGFMLMGKNIEGRMRNEDILRQQEAKWRSLFESSKDVVYISDLDGNLIEMNQTGADLFGYKQEEILSKNMKEFYKNPEDRDAFVEKIRTHKYVKDHEAELVNRKGELIFARITAAIQKDKAGKISGYQGIIRDATEHKKKEEAISFLAFHDALTSLPNRRTFEDRLSNTLEHAKRTKETGAVMFMDLDGFKAVNDNLGHDVGDALLKKVAEILNSCVRAEDTVARFGGDEFVILLPVVRSVKDAAMVANKVVGAINQTQKIMCNDLLVGMSIGIALFPDDGLQPDILIKKADNAMYLAKQSGKNCYKVYSENF